MPNPLGDNHSGLYARLVRNTRIDGSEACGCWTWTGKRNKGYPRLNIRHSGRLRTVKAHRAMLVVMELEGEMEHFFNLYDAYTAAGFDADHTCWGNPLCINPSHLQWLPGEDHDKKRHDPAQRHPDELAARRRALLGADLPA